MSLTDCHEHLPRLIGNLCSWQPSRDPVRRCHGQPKIGQLMAANVRYIVILHLNFVMRHRGGLFPSRRTEFRSLALYAISLFGAKIQCDRTEVNAPHGFKYSVTVSNFPPHCSSTSCAGCIACCLEGSTVLTWASSSPLGTLLICISSSVPLNSRSTPRAARRGSTAVVSPSSSSRSPYRTCHHREVIRRSQFIIPFGMRRLWHPC